MDRNISNHVKIVTIEITKETEDLRPNAVLKNGKKKIMYPGHMVMGYEEVVQPFLKAKVATIFNGKTLFNQVTTEDK